MAVLGFLFAALMLMAIYEFGGLNETEEEPDGT